jgi:hypothetical protein
VYVCQRPRFLEMNPDKSESDEESPNPEIDAFQRMMNSHAKKKQKVEVDPIVIAVIYIRWLRWIFEGEPLYNIPYVGQSVRSMNTPQKVAEDRWKQENRQAVRECKELGLIACLDTYGSNAFYDELVEWRQGPRSEVQKWANEREIATIAQHGGPLRDPSKKLNQTLNLTKGGQGSVNFESRDAARTVAWLKFKRNIETYVECYGTSLVPTSYINPCNGYKLGNELASVRIGRLWKGHPDETQRVCWLQSLPNWLWHVREINANSESLTKARQRTSQKNWELFCCEMEKYVCANNSSLVPTNYVNPTTKYNLGKELSVVRRGQLWRGYPDELQRKRWLESLPGWAWKAQKTTEFREKMRQQTTSTQFQSWSPEKRNASKAKQREKMVANRAKVLATLTGHQLDAKEKEYARTDAKQANRKGKAKALLKLPEYAHKNYEWCYRNQTQAKKNGVSFFQDASNEWHARMGNKGDVGSSAEHAVLTETVEAL